MFYNINKTKSLLVWIINQIHSSIVLSESNTYYYGYTAEWWENLKPASLLTLENL